MDELDQIKKNAGVKKVSDGETGFHANIESETLSNEFFRKVLYTTDKSQLVLMTLQPGEEIGAETHDGDQFFRFESGTGEAILNEKVHPIKDGDTIIVPTGVNHNIVNTSDTEKLKLYALYSPPQHKKGTVHKTKEGATEEHFDGKTDLKN